jgi:methylphosphotriester-DNA--protein-cysteine methyltransferase
MIHHTDTGADEQSRRRAIRRLIVSGQIAFAGYKPGKIYGRLSCASGKRMKPQNRVFFRDEQEAISTGYRPCAHCMPAQYRQWRVSGEGLTFEV